MIVKDHAPVRFGVATALATALAFGLTIPVLAWAGADVCPCDRGRLVLGSRD